MLSIILPSIRDVSKYINSLDNSLVDIEYEIIVVSPNEKEIPKTKLQKSQKLIVDKGSPSRCLQIGICNAEEKIVTWGTDDGVCRAGALKKCVDILRGSYIKDGVIVKYTEDGPGTFTGALDEYYISKNHAANRQPGINPNWKIAPVGMFYTSYFKSLGGIDCRFEHINMNIHDFVYRLQIDGGKLHYSPEVVMHCNSNNWGLEHRVLDFAFSYNDLPLFKELYKDNTRSITIELDNWKDSPEVWRRFI